MSDLLRTVKCKILTICSNHELGMNDLTLALIALEMLQDNLERVLCVGTYETLQEDIP